ncbi:MAG TPA: nuclear transport factor 2 family protein [Pyrinomonadaceae bacterium]
MNNAPSMATDEAAVRRTVQLYIDGGIAGKSDVMKQAFDEGSTIYGYAGEDLFAGSIQKLYDWVDANGPASDLQAQISKVDIENTIATVRLELDNWRGMKFTDMFTLLKLDGEWKIISKVFYLHPGN